MWVAPRLGLRWRGRPHKIHGHARVHVSLSLSRSLCLFVPVSSLRHDMTLSDDPFLVPVHALRFTHHSINADLAFGEDHDNRQESIFKLHNGKPLYDPVSWRLLG